MVLNENSIFYKDLCCDSIKQYIKETEIEDLVQAIGLSKPETFVKKHMVWAWHQIIIANFFAGHISPRECPKEWGFASEESTWKFLTTASAYFEKYTHLHTKDSTINIYLRVCNLTDKGKENLEIANSILTLIHEKIMAFPSQEKKLSRIPKNTTEWQYFLLENVPFFQLHIHRYCIDLLEGDYHYYSNSNFNTLFTGYIYPNSDLKIYQEKVSENFLRFLKVLIMFAYSYNNKKWVVPRPKNVKTYDEVTKFFDSLHKYHGDNLEFLDSLIEASLPKENNNYNIEENIYVLKNKNVPITFEGATPKEIPKEFSKVYPKYYAGELTKNDLFKMFNIKEAAFQKWVGELDLPIKTSRFEALEVPTDFESMYYKFLEGEVSKPKLLKDLNVSDRTLYTWIKGKGLPLKKDYTKKLKIQPTIASVKPPVQVLPIEKSIFKFSLFGYKFSFTAKKEESLKSVNVADEFPDEIEY